MTIIQTNKPLQPRKNNDYYPTPIELARASLSLLPEDFTPHITIDPGAGDGIFGKAVTEKYDFTWMIGVEFRDVEKPRGYTEWYKNSDYLQYNSRLENLRVDLIIGNPPYKLDEEFINKSFQYLNDGGYLLFLLRLSFLESKGRYYKYYSNGFNPKEVAVSTRRVSFRGDKKSDNTAYALYLWQKGWKGDTKLSWLDWNYE